MRHETVLGGWWGWLLHAARSRAVLGPLLAGLLALVLAGCSGGGGSDAPPASPPASPPAVATQPQSATVADGQAASFSVTATGESLRYQWQRNGVDVAGANTAGLAIAAALLADSGARYRVVVSNAGGSVTSAEATLTVTPVAPRITTPPAPASVQEGATATFTVTAAGSAPLAFQWLRNGVDIAGATAASYTTPALVLSDNGASYAVRVSNAAGPVTSAGAALTVTAAPVAVAITTPPAGASVTAGQTATFSVVATGSPPLAYQWLRNGTAISGATAASYTTPATALADTGTQFSVVVSNGVNSVTSATATLAVSAAPVGASVRLSLAATSTVALRADGTLLAWGSNAQGQLGSGPAVAGSPARVVTTGVLAFSNNDLGGLVLKAGGQVEGWGTNEGGWLGGSFTAGAEPTFGTPVAVVWPRAVLAVSAGLQTWDPGVEFSWVLLDDGTVWHLPGSRTISGSTLSFAPAQVTGLTGIAALSGGHGAAYAIGADGSVWSITLRQNLGSGPTFFTATASRFSGLANIAAVNCGTSHCLALTRDGTLMAWGEGRSGQLGHGVASSSGTPVAVSGLSNVTHFAATSNIGTSVARTADGRVWSWGRGELSGRPSVRSGALLLPPPNVSVPTEVPSLAGSAEVACSVSHCAARRNDGTVWTWGTNMYNQLGVTGPGTQEPVQVPGINLN